MVINMNAPAFLTTNWLPKLATLAAALVLAGCSLAPTYKVPETATVPAFKEAEAAQAEGAQWKTATPAEGQHRGDWWKIFGDAELDRLIERLAVPTRIWRLPLPA